MEKIYRFTRVYGTTAAGVIAVVGVLVYEKYQKSPVYSSWTTAYDPSVKWDYNWDKFVLMFCFAFFISFFSPLFFFARISMHAYNQEVRAQT